MTRVLFVVGYGMNIREHLTLGALHVMRGADASLFLGNCGDFLRELKLKRIIELNHMYENGVLDSVAYLKIAEKIVSVAVKNSSTTLILPGHPLLGVSLLPLLRKYCQTNQVEIRTLPGVSSFDTMLIDLNLDPLERGAMLIDANRLLLFQLSIDPCVNVFLYHICSVATARINYSTPEKDSQINLLRHYLQNSYKDSHCVHLLSSQVDTNSTTILSSATIGSMSSLANKITYHSSLFIPAAKPTRIDRNYLSAIQGMD